MGYTGPLRGPRDWPPDSRCQTSGSGSRTNPSRDASVQYRFRGLKRESGEQVTGRVGAADEDAAYKILAKHGIVGEILKPDSGQQDGQTTKVKAAQVAQALERALDDAGTQVGFDKLSQRLKGKNVWVLDREKIRNRVMKVVDDAIVKSLHDDDNRKEARQRIANLLEDMFQDQQNVASERSTNTVALEDQVSRLTTVVSQIERAMTSMSMAAKRTGRGDRQVARSSAEDNKHTEVLLEIFENNLKLLRDME